MLSFIIIVIIFIIFIKIILWLMKDNITDNIIILGSPVRDRAWILPDYLEHIYALEYPKKNIILKFLINDSNDESFSILNNFCHEHSHEYKSFNIEEKKYNHPYDGRLDRANRGIYKNIALIRNEWKNNNDNVYNYIFNIDTDILCHPRTLIELLKTAYEKENCGMVSALISNDPAGFGFHSVGYNNTMLEVIYGVEKCKSCINYIISNNTGICHLKDMTVEDGHNCRDYKRNYDIEMRLLRYKRIMINNNIEVPLTGACCIVPKEINDKCFYKESLHGEDYPFCLDIRRLGYKLYCNTHINNRHIMAKSWLDKIKSDREKYYRLGYINFDTIVGINSPLKFDYSLKNEKR